MKRKSLFISLFLAAALALAGCGSGKGNEEPKSSTGTTEGSIETPTAEAGTDQKKEVKNIVFVTPLIGHPVWLDAKAGYEAAGEEYGFETQWVGPEGIDMDSMVKQIEAAIAQKVDGIITCPLNPSAFTAVYQQAQEAGIPIVNTAVDTGEDTRLAYIGTDEENFGRTAAEALAEKLGGKGKIACMQTSMDSENQNNQYNAFEKTLKEKYPDMEIVVREVDNSDMLTAVDKFNAILQSTPDINGIMCFEASAGPAAAKVLLEKGITEEVSVLAIDDMEDTLGYIRDGAIWGTLTQDFYRMGYEGAKFIVDAAEGSEVPSITDSGTILVTKDNIDTYKKSE